jgi:hypothetical protein
MQTKLTLRLDEDLIRTAKVIGREKGQSVSKMVAVYFQSLSENQERKRPYFSPTIKALKGAWRGKNIDQKDYRRYLEKKYL